MGLYDSTKQILGAWKDAKVRQFQGTPQTKVDSAGGISDYNFDGQNATRKELEEVKEIRESGGVISYLVHAKALMQFGTGAEFQTENEDLREWLRDELPNYDNMLIELGEDAIWYPYSIAEIVETQGGSFSHIEPVEPWTMEPVENEYGEVIAWEQKIGRETTTFDPGELASIILNKSSGRDNTGISEVLRAEEEIRGFKENRQTVNKALEFLVPHNHWVVGKESGQVIDDNELRRVRNMVDDMEGDTQFITGPDVEQNEISLTEFDYSSIQERDLREVALALGLPLELANIGSDGLGSGMPADLRLTLFERQARAAQRSLTNQVDDELIRPIIEEYSPFPVEDFEGTRLSDPIAEREENSLSDIAPYLTLNEIREELDKPPEDDEEKGESYRKPANIEAPEEEEPEDEGGPFGGMFEEGDRDFRSLSDDEFREFETWVQSVHSDFVTAEETDKSLTQFNESQVPEAAKERLKEAIRGGAVFSHFEDLPSSELMDLRQSLTDMLTDDNWSLDNMAAELSDRFDVSEDKAETWARTETQSAVNHAYEDALEEQGLADEEVFKWVGAGQDEQPERTTDACQFLLEKTNPEYGGSPVTLERLKELVQESVEHDDDINTQPRTFTPHINCRKRYVRHVA